MASPDYGTMPKLRAGVLVRTAARPVPVPYNVLCDILAML